MELKYREKMEWNHGEMGMETQVNGSVRQTHVLPRELAALVEEGGVRVVLGAVQVEANVDYVDWFVFCRGGAWDLHRRSCRERN